MKKTITAITLAIVTTFGATFANAGIIVSDSNSPAPCEKDGIIVAGRGGIIVAGLTGIIVAGFTGIILNNDTTPAPCSNTTDGIIVAG